MYYELCKTCNLVKFENDYKIIFWGEFNPESRLVEKKICSLNLMSMKFKNFFIFIFCYKLSLAENRVLLCVSRHHHTAVDFLVQVKERKDSKLQVTGKNTHLSKASSCSTILVCRGNLISKSAVLRNVNVFSYIFSSYSIFLPIGWE